MKCANCGKEIIYQTFLPDEWCEDCLERDRQQAHEAAERAELDRLDLQLRKRP